MCGERAYLMTDLQRTSLCKRIKEPLEHDGHIDTILERFLLPIFKATPQLLAKDPRCLKENVLYWLYPKIDFDVSKTAYHLKKLPLLPHPTSQYLSLPLPSIQYADLVPFDEIKIRSKDLTTESFYSLYAKQIDDALKTC